jgi:hypothetical protein
MQVNTGIGATGSVWIESGSGATAGPGGGGGGGTGGTAGTASFGGNYGGGRGGGSNVAILGPVTAGAGIIVFTYNAGPTYITGSNGFTVTNGARFSN